MSEAVNFYIYTLYNSKFVYRQMFIKTRHLQTYVFPIIYDDFFTSHSLQGSTYPLKTLS